MTATNLPFDQAFSVHTLVSWTVAGTSLRRITGRIFAPLAPTIGHELNSAREILIERVFVL
jgi:hypothetical protein